MKEETRDEHTLSIKDSLRSRKERNETSKGREVRDILKYP